jgi:glycosyltransferase involved in cell wall biosynthesis
MNERPIAYVMEQTLGNVTHYLNLKTRDAHEAGARRWVPIGYPRTNLRLNWTLLGGLMTRRALHEVMEEIDGIFIHTTTLATLCFDYFGKKPTVLSTDGTPQNKRDMRSSYGLKPENRLSREAKHLAYRKIFGNAAGFVGWSNWAKESFVRDYGCPEENVVVIPPGVDLEQFRAGDRAHELPRLLFVGGDFARKGGNLLLDVFRRRLRGRAELDIVTRDPIPEESGVRVHRDVSANSDKLRNLYATSDVFVLPTRADCYSLVCMEAMAASLPCVVTRAGGIDDLVTDGDTGYLVGIDDDDALGDALETLVTDGALRERMSRRSREIAEEKLDVQKTSRRLFEYVRSRC